MKKTFIHMEVGNCTWTPTDDELESMKEMLQEVLKETSPGETAVFATREGVKISVIEFDPVAAYLGHTFSTNQTNQNAPFVAYTTGQKP